MSKRAKPVESDNTDEDDSSSSDNETSPETSDQEDDAIVSEDMFAGLEFATGQESENEDLLMDEDDRSESMPTLPSPVIHTQPEWKWIQGGNNELALPFDDNDGSWNIQFDAATSEFDFFTNTFPEEVILKTVREMNRFATSHVQKCQPNLTRRQKNWRDVNYNEFMRFICIRVIMGIDRKPQMTNYWSSDPLIKSTIVPGIMTSVRFFEIQQYLHFCNNDEQEPGDRLHKIRQVWELFNHRWSEILEPAKDLSVDESLIKFKGRLSWKQFIPSKRNRFGIKTFSVVDAKTGFVLHSKIYAGKGKEEMKYDMKQYGYGGSIVLELCEKYLMMRRRIFIDNYFTSPTLAVYLLEKQTYMCGTLRSNRKNCPKVPKPFIKGEIAAFTAEGDKKGVMVEYWRDKKVVRMISTGMEHEVLEITKGGKIKNKPKTILDYNQYARGIDLSDMQIHMYETSRKSLKWYKKIFFRATEIAIYNAYVLFKVHHPKTTFLAFRMNLVRQILAKTGGTTSNKFHPFDHPLRLTERHFLKYNPPNEKTEHGHRRCCVCSKHKKESRTVYKCIECNVPLCAVPCFEIYHTRKSY